jgi:hypothetical protein
LLVRGLEAAYRDFQKIGIHKGEPEDRKADHAGLSRS